MTRSRVRLAAVAALCSVLLLTASPVVEATPTPPTPIEEVAGQGGFLDKLLCTGCIGVIVAMGSGVPGLMIYYSIGNAAFVHGCSLACIIAFT